MVIVDTCLRHDVDKTMLQAFFYGQLHGKYKLYKDLETGKLSIRFDVEEDATVFKLKRLDEIFNTEFDGARKSRDSLDLSDLRQRINAMPFGKTTY